MGHPVFSIIMCNFPMKYEPYRVRLLVGQSVGHNFLKARKVKLPCSFRNPCYPVEHLGSLRVGNLVLLPVQDEHWYSHLGSNVCSDGTGFFQKACFFCILRFWAKACRDLVAFEIIVSNFSIIL